MKQAGTVIVMALLSLALCGCSDEPGANDMKQAIVSNPAMAALARIGGHDLSDLVVDKGGCAAATGVPGYVCDVRVGYRAGGQAQYGAWGKGRFFKTNGGWQFQEIR